ncbi:MAG: hypothetical protein JO034_18780 [Singulisphaera sp.]|nr:hypothetical protein [Singulisphaera sp.]
MQRITSSEKFPPVKSGKPPTITGPAWSKMNKKQQDAKTKEYNDDQEKKQAKANKKAFDDGVATHLNNSRGRIFRWEDQDYILPHTER